MATTNPHIVENPLLSCYKRKEHPNLKIIWYEDMKRDLVAVIKDLAVFLEKHLTAFRILKLDDLLFIDNFRKVTTEAAKNPLYKKFIRKGKVGDWKEYFTTEKNKLWDDWIAKHLEGTDIQLSFE